MNERLELSLHTELQCRTAAAATDACTLKLHEYFTVFNGNKLDISSVKLNRGSYLLNHIFYRR